MYQITNLLGDSFLFQGHLLNFPANFSLLEKEEVAIKRLVTPVKYD